MVASFAPNNEKERGDLVERRDQVMVIGTKTESVYYPVSKQRLIYIIRGSGRIRYVRGLVVVNPKILVDVTKENWSFGNGEAQYGIAPK
jgi:hypothetical protein